MNVRQRMAIERRVVRKMIRAMKAAGWIAVRVFDGEENVRCRSEREVMDAAFSVDESCVKFSKELPSGEKLLRSAAIALGNDGYDAIADHSVSDPNKAGDDFEAVMDSVYDYCCQLQG